MGSGPGYILSSLVISFGVQIYHSPESCHSLLWYDSHSSSGFCGLSYEEAAMAAAGLPLLVATAHGWQTYLKYACRGVAAGKPVASRAQHRVLSQLPPTSMEMPSSAFLKVTVRTMERTGSPNSSPHSEDAEV